MNVQSDIFKKNLIQSDNKELYTNVIFLVVW